MREEDCIIDVMHGSMRQSHVYFALVTNVYLSLRTFLPTFLLFSVFPSLYIPFCFRISNRKIARKTVFLSRAVLRLCFDNMENLEDTFRSLSRFVRGRCYAVLITVYNNVAFCIYTYIKNYNR